MDNQRNRNILAALGLRLFMLLLLTYAFAWLGDTYWLPSSPSWQPKVIKMQNDALSVLRTVIADTSAKTW
ncbi:MAG: hypothetical protein PHE17_20880 [Thiothrix sp.]|uniref:hypothetical protein n=1 Tax=Thiothrix sp. TaxID=1032 RepID=UPI002610EE80|nr:hypothetical protein [Thiothrix sp.]MDD5395486.1 hypothetical protein [Thiothrix sp.]